MLGSFFLSPTVGNRGKPYGCTTAGLLTKVRVYHGHRPDTIPHSTTPSV